MVASWIRRMKNACYNNNANEDFPLAWLFVTLQALLNFLSSPLIRLMHRTVWEDLVTWSNKLPGVVSHEFIYLNLHHNFWKLNKMYWFNIILLKMILVWLPCNLIDRHVIAGKFESSKMHAKKRHYRESKTEYNKEYSIHSGGYECPLQIVYRSIVCIRHR